MELAVRTDAAGQTAHPTRYRLAAALVGLAAVLALVMAPPALAVNPEQTVGGNGSKWFSGTLLQQSGNNCTIIGGSYSETMVSAIAGYGGAPGGQVPKVGDRYYASLLVSIPGNPCGTGSSVVGTDLVLPRGTTVDTSAPIRCFGQPRNANTFGELTGGDWNFLGSTGKWCPAQVGSSLTGTSGAVGVGFRPLANGQLYQLFVPIKSTQSLIGAGANPADEVRWVLSTSGTYSNQGATSVWANVLPSAGGQPYIYFARNPSVVPFWLNSPPAGEGSNRVEWFANLYSAGLPGTLCFELYETTVNPAGVLDSTCNKPGLIWNGAVTAGPDTWQVVGGGPNGGFVPFYYGNNETYRIHWIFTPNVGTPVTNDITFRTLPGPDLDGDGVADSSDACPAVKGTLANGCQPAVQADPDGDGVFGAADKCPDKNGGSALDGCPPAAPANTGQPGQTGQGEQRGPEVQTPPGLTLTGSLGAIKGNKIKRAALKKGFPLQLTCGLDSDAAATLTVTSAVAKKLKLKVKKGQKSLPIGSAKGRCTAAKGGKLTLKLQKSVAGKVLKSRKAIAASLGVAFTRTGSAPVNVIRPLKLT